MILKTIVCSGPNESTKIEEIARVLERYPIGELGIQVSGKKASFGTARYWWLEALYSYMRLKGETFSVALHVNSDWVEKLTQGEVVPELDHWLKLLMYDGKPFIKRVQLNFRIGRERTPDLRKLVATINKFPNQRFILSYNEENADFINKIHEEGLPIDCLFDRSFGERIVPETYFPPVYPDIFQGYAGGLSPENVNLQLSKIAKVAGDRDIFIDAEGGLKGDDGHFSVAKAEQYLHNALNWENS